MRLRRSCLRSLLSVSPQNRRKVPMNDLEVCQTRVYRDLERTETHFGHGLQARGEELRRK